MESRASPFSELILYLTSLSGSLPLALFVFIAESMCIGRSAGVPGGADERVRVVEELEVEVGRFQGLFRPFLAGAGERDKTFVVDLLLFVSKISSRRRPTCTISSLLICRTFIVLASPMAASVFRQLGFAVLADAKPGVSARPALLGVV